MRRWIMLLAAVWACALPATAQTPSRSAAAMEAARLHMLSHEQEIVAELRDLLALPNVASNSDDITANADALVTLLERRGFSARVLRTPDAADAVYGALRTPGARRTIVFYAHFDGQPVEPLEAWATPPFTPTLRNHRLEDDGAIIPWETATYPLDDNARIYARSASDDKAPIIAMLAALDALRAAHIPLSVNLKFFLEGEEEAGSPNLARVLQAHRPLLASDLWIFADGPRDPRGFPRITLGVRGVATFQITVFGAAISLHSGHYGNVAPNPAARLAHLIASMRAADGAILVDGLQGEPPSQQVRDLARAGFDTDVQLRGPGLGRTESGLSYGESLLRPALNVTQLSFGGTGPQRNAIDPEASAGFDIRLTPGISVADARAAIERHLRNQGYLVLDRPPTHEERLEHDHILQLDWNGLGYPAAMSSLDNPGVARVVAVMRQMTQDEVSITPLIGGSLPIAPIGDILHTPFVIVPIVNADNNQHAPNENIRMADFRSGVGIFAGLLADVGQDWR